MIKRKRRKNTDTSDKKLQPGYRNRFWHWKMCHGDHKRRGKERERKEYHYQIRKTSGNLEKMKITSHHELLARFSLTLSLSLSFDIYHPSLSAGFPGYVLCSYRAAVDKFWLVVLHLHVRVKGSIGERRLWDRACSSSNVPHVLFI